MVILLYPGWEDAWALTTSSRPARGLSGVRETCKSAYKRTSGIRRFSGIEPHKKAYCFRPSWVPLCPHIICALARLINKRPLCFVSLISLCPSQTPPASGHPPQPLLRSGMMFIVLLFASLIHRPPLSASTKCSVAPPSSWYSCAVLSSALRGNCLSFLYRIIQDLRMDSLSSLAS